ncbi:MAG: tetratricopeptide (TPR) repeat protein [Planctomycetota bacterium]|jgi:tetratricopeptide (TPR) repeat protein
MSMRRSLPQVAFLSAIGLFAACNTPNQNSEPKAVPNQTLPEASPAQSNTGENLQVDRAIQALHGDDFEAAYELLQEILLEQYLDQARTLIDAEIPNPQDGLLFVDKALGIDNRSLDAILLRARGTTALGNQMIANGGNGIYIQGAFEESLDAYEQAIARMETKASALFGASRAAYQLSLFEEALAHAERGMQAIAEQGEAPELNPIPERSLAEAAYQAYTQSLVEENADRALELFTVAETALNELLGRTPSEPWAWTTLSNLYLWNEQPDAAKSALAQGLDRVPDNADLLANLVNISKSEGGLSAALLDINNFVNNHPDIAGGYWWLGSQRFEVGLEKLVESPADIEDFEAAERAFARARELDPALANNCLGYEVNCRNGIGRAHYNEGNLEAATAAYLSMNELLPRGVEWRYDGRLFSGIEGLNFVGAAYNERGDWGGAAATYELLRTLQPDAVQWANNAAFFHRDLAVELEQVGKDLCRRSISPPTEPDEVARLLELAGLEASEVTDLSTALAERSEQNLTLARATIEKSYEAYLDVERLAPDDVRLVNDSALIRVWYLYRDFDHAIELLERSIAMGTEQIQDPTLSEDDRDALENAWGDAYQNLGYLYLVNLKQPDKARPYLEKCVGLGDPRPLVTRTLIPMCDGDPDHPQLDEFRAWGRSCGEVISQQSDAK